MVRELIILEEDKAWIKQRIAELQKIIQSLGPEFYEVFNQSSETWHDNAPFDALRDRQSVLDAELQTLRGILRDSVPGAAAIRKGIAGIGSTVRLTTPGQTNKAYFIAGDWTASSGISKDGVVTVSAQAPLAQELIGKKVNDTTKFGIITEIHYA